MKLFIDSAIIEEIESASKLGVISGATTNPSLLKKSGKTLQEVIKNILMLIDGPISAEVSESDEETMLNQALQIVEMANNENITIKLPMTEDGLKVCKKLSQKNIKTNVTLVFSLSQAILAMEAGATFISPFMGRLDDLNGNNTSGYDLIKKISEYKKISGKKTQIIAASIRNINHVEQASLAGADIATIPFKVIKELYNHELTTKGLKKFKEDEQK